MTVHATRTFTVLLLTALLAACGGTTPPSGDGGTTPPPATPGTPAPTNPDAPAPYVMQGVVKNAQDQPLAGVEVWADNTLYYNMNVLGVTDAQGRYRLELPRDVLGTWRAGGRFQRSYHGETYELSLEVNDETAFTADTGAFRNFTLKTSGERPDGHYYGGTVWVYGNYSAGDFKNRDVELTLTPDGPLLDGSTGETLTRFVDGNTIADVPIGRYKVTARHVPEGGAPRNMLVMRQDEDTFAPSTILMFRKEPQYGVMTDVNLKLAPLP